MLHLVSEPTLAVTHACAGQGSGMWRMARPVVAHDMACQHWTHVRVRRGDVPCLRLTDEDVGLLGVCV
jgi:hypothetical protein